MYWAIKVCAKLVLSRLPVSYATWKRLGLFQHGSMDSMEYAFNVFRHHLARAGVELPLAGQIVCELGPGDSLASALIARCAGAQHVFLVDVGPFASPDPSTYENLAGTLQSHGLHVPPDVRFDSIPGYLESCRATYLTDGLRSLRSIASGSIDLIWSHAVLEHVRSREFPEFAREMYRITKPGGAGSHRVDLQDHLGGALNNLRFPAKLWEWAPIARSGFYTNRIQYSSMLTMFRRTGFDVQIPQIDRWSKLPTPRNSMSREFRGIADEELRISGFDLVTRKPTAN